MKKHKKKQNENNHRKSKSKAKVLDSADVVRRQGASVNSRNDEKSKKE